MHSMALHTLTSSESALLVPLGSPRTTATVPPGFWDDLFVPQQGERLIKALSESHSIMGLNQTCSSCCCRLDSQQRLLPLAQSEVITLLCTQGTHPASGRGGGGEVLAVKGISVSKHNLSVATYRQAHTGHSRRQGRLQTPA